MMTLTLKFMASQQTTAINILLNISISKDNQTIIFDHLIEYITWETFLLKNHPQNVAKILFPGPF